MGQPRVRQAASSEAIVPATQQTLDAWRTAGGLVVHTREAHKPDLSDCPPAKRNRGTAVLLVSEDLDELLHLSDRIVVMSEGRIVFECPAAGADRRTLGSHMGGHGTAHPSPVAQAAEPVESVPA